MLKDKRKSLRRPVRYTAWLMLEADRLHGCVLSNVSDTGARIDVEDAKTIPDYFLLLLSGNGSAQRKCRVVWRKPRQVGVIFERRLADGAKTTLVPKRADTDAAKVDAAKLEPPDALVRRDGGLIAKHQVCWIAESSQSPPRARMKVHNSVTSLGSPPSTVRPLARSTMLSLSAKCMATVA